MELQRQEVVQIIRESTESVFSTMLGMPIVNGPVRQEQGDPAPVEGVIAMVGIAGPWTGMGQIYCSAELACQLAGALLMSEYSSVDGDVLDAMAEVANMIIGNVKTGLETRLGQLGLGVPTVVYGRNYQARTGGVHDWTVVPFFTDERKLEVRFCLLETRVNARVPGMREPAVV